MPASDDNGADDFEQIGDDGILRRMLRYDGELKSLTEWARAYGQSKYNLCNRLRWGWSIEKAITTPVKMRTRTKRAVKELHEQFDAAAAKPVDRTTPEGIRAVAKKIVARMGYMTALQHLMQLQKEYGEKKFAACKRLRRERRYEQFVTRKRAYAAATKSVPGISKHIVFYLALEDFPALNPKG